MHTQEKNVTKLQSTEDLISLIKSDLSKCYEQLEMTETNSQSRWKFNNSKYTVNEHVAQKYIDFVNEQFELGYTYNDLQVSLYIDLYIYIYIKNKISKYGVGKDDLVKFDSDSELTKCELIASLQEYNDYVTLKVCENRNALLNNREACVEFIEAKKFYQNYLEKMMIDKETHDYILQVKTELEQEKENAELEKIEKVKNWGLEHGSDDLKRRIELGFNYYSYAIREYNISILPEQYYLSDDEYCNSSNPDSAILQKFIEEKKIHKTAKLVYDENEIDEKHYYSKYKRYYSKITLKSLDDSEFNAYKRLD